MTLVDRLSVTELTKQPTSLQIFNVHIDLIHVRETSKQALDRLQ